MRRVPASRTRCETSLSARPASSAAAFPALAADVRPDAPEEDFREFNRRFALAAYHYPRHGAAPLGLIGFDVYADAAVDQELRRRGVRRRPSSTTT